MNPFAEICGCRWLYSCFYCFSIAPYIIKKPWRNSSAILEISEPGKMLPPVSFWIAAYILGHIIVFTQISVFVKILGSFDFNHIGPIILRDDGAIMVTVYESRRRPQPQSRLKLRQMRSNNRIPPRHRVGQAELVGGVAGAKIVEVAVDPARRSGRTREKPRGTTTMIDLPRLFPQDLFLPPVAASPARTHECARLTSRATRRVWSP